MDVARSRALLVCVTLLSTEHVLAACESAAGSWSAVWNLGPIPYQYTFNLAQSGAAISGSLTMTSCGPFTVSGLFYGNSAFAVTATPNPPNGADCTQFSYMGTVDKPGCHNTSGAWVEAGEPWAWSKPCDIPGGESSAPGTWSAAGTSFRWQVSVSPSSINFAGRTLAEHVSATDHCWFSGSAIAEQTGSNAPPFDLLHNGYEDDVGWLPAAVTYYRGQGRAPCSFSATQQMTIDCASGPVTYIVNGLGGTIGVTTVSSSRQGQTQARTWP